MLEKSAKTYWCKIYIAGPISVAEQYIRKECLQEGLCINIYPNKYIYTGGEEIGFVIELINYPKFPKSNNEILSRAKNIMMGLLEETYQHSALLMTPDITKWVSKRQ